MTRLNATERSALVELRMQGAAVRVSRSSSSWRVGGMIRKNLTMQALVDAGLAVRTGGGMAGQIVVTDAGKLFDVLREENRRR